MVAQASEEDIADWLERQGWSPVSGGPPEGEWLRTKLVGEDGESVSFCRRMHPNDDLEWISPDGYTTVTHSTYAAPSHFKRLPELRKRE